MAMRLISQQQEIDFAGERVSHLYPNDCYFAHLSIYNFALQFVNNAAVLDAGCGAGYGTHYFSTHGAHFVTGIDVSTEAIEFARSYFSSPNLEYQVMDLQKIHDFPDQSFDLIFSSNALEHIQDLRPFFLSACTILKSEGTLVIAVPPVVDDISLRNNLDNPYHLNIWSPDQWNFILGQYFDEVQPYFHDFNKPGIKLDFNNTVEQTIVNENDFLFKSVTIDQFLVRTPITVIFTARHPRPRKAIPGAGQNMEFIDSSFTRTPPLVQTLANIRQNRPSLLTKGLDVLFRQGPLIALRKAAAHFAKPKNRL